MNFGNQMQIIVLGADKMIMKTFDDVATSGMVDFREPVFEQVSQTRWRNYGRFNDLKVVSDFSFSLFTPVLTKLD
jgi:hypothetical protein